MHGCVDICKCSVEVPSDDRKCSDVPQASESSESNVRCMLPTFREELPARRRSTLPVAAVPVTDSCR